MRRQWQRARGRSRILAVLLLACLLVFSLAGCQADQSESADNGGRQEAVVADTADADGTDQAFPADDADSIDTQAEPADSDAGPEAERAADEKIDTSGGDSGELDVAIPADGSYTSKEDVALYLHSYGRLPDNFISKKEAQKLGWSGGSLEPYAPGKCIGGDRFGNYEGVLPEGIAYHECDIDTLGADKRGVKRIVYGEDGTIYYTDDHYQSFTQLY